MSSTDDFFAKLKAQDEYEAKRQLSKTNGLSVRRLLAEQDNLIRQMDATADGFAVGAADYVPEAAKSRWQKNMTRFAPRVAQLHALADELAEHSQAHVANTRASLLPTATDVAERLATELEVQRILSRDQFKDARDVFPYMLDAEPSPTRTVILSELQARGIATDRQIEAALRGSSPEYQQALNEHNGIMTSVNSAIAARNEHMMKRMESWQAPKIPKGRDWEHPHSMAGLTADQLGTAADIEFTSVQPIGNTPTCDPAYSSYLPAEESN